MNGFQSNRSVDVEVEIDSLFQNWYFLNRLQVKRCHSSTLLNTYKRLVVSVKAQKLY